MEGNKSGDVFAGQLEKNLEAAMGTWYACAIKTPARFKQLKDVDLAQIYVLSSVFI